MELEDLSPATLVGHQQDVEPIAAWVYRGIIPSLKLGKLRRLNCALPRHWLLEQERSA